MVASGYFRLYDFLVLRYPCFWGTYGDFLEVLGFFKIVCVCDSVVVCFVGESTWSEKRARHFITHVRTSNVVNSAVFFVF